MVREYELIGRIVERESIKLLIRIPHYILIYVFYLS